ncbi:MAG TPA: peptidylprolyl isomerase [Ideonella sp.]|uniref:peptidylprolyl isomerase n=1 Tax=Ideonella sp. TaxID=1929293 RepID=UPI002E3316B6|nr:peptidylprolyl isomerase [Ideonella sp.]HEX5687272.1 peptidylprolyl isomerase [Ideonella sp.]
MAAPSTGLTVAQVLERSPAGDWRPLDPQNTLLMDLGSDGSRQVIIELAPRFAPRHVANIRTLAHEGYWDGLAIMRVQDNYVTQWGDPNTEVPEKAKPLGKASPKLPAEFSVPLKGLPLVRLPDADGWAPITGFVDGMPVAADPKTGQAWLAHCYGIVGAGRDMAKDSSNGTELYAVIGQSPRGLDLNITVVGRVLQGMQHLAALPRGGADMGFYGPSEPRTPIQRVRLLADVPETERPALEVLRTDSTTWPALLQARRVRKEEWFLHSPQHINLCNATVPTRPRMK